MAEVFFTIQVRPVATSRRIHSEPSTTMLTARVSERPRVARALRREARVPEWTVPFFSPAGTALSMSEICWAAVVSRAPRVVDVTARGDPPLVVALTRSVPTWTVPTSARKAETSLATSLRARDTATDTVTATTPPASATDAAATTARTWDASVADTVSACADRDVAAASAGSPETEAWTTVAIRFSVEVPAAVRAPATAPPAMATEMARTRASMELLDAAVTVTSPSAWIDERST